MVYATKKSDRYNLKRCRPVPSFILACVPSLRERASQGVNHGNEKQNLTKYNQEMIFLQEIHGEYVVCDRSTRTVSTMRHFDNEILTP